MAPSEINVFLFLTSEGRCCFSVGKKNPPSSYRSKKDARSAGWKRRGGAREPHQEEQTVSEVLPEERHKAGSGFLWAAGRWSQNGWTSGAWGKVGQCVWCVWGREGEGVTQSSQQCFITLPCGRKMCLVGMFVQKTHWQHNHSHPPTDIVALTSLPFVSCTMDV